MIFIEGIKRRGNLEIGDRDNPPLSIPSSSYFRWNLLIFVNGRKIPSRSINFFPLFRRGEEVIHPSSTEQREATRFRWGRRRDTFKRNTAMTRYPSSRRRKSERKERNLRIGKREREIRVSNTRSDAPVKGRERRRRGRKCISPRPSKRSNFGSRNFQQLSWKFSYYANLPRMNPTAWMG